MMQTHQINGNRSEELWTAFGEKPSTSSGSESSEKGTWRTVRTMESELLRQGLTLRQVQQQLVATFQPLDGTRTRHWETPDSWKCGVGRRPCQRTSGTSRICSGPTST